MIDPVYDKGYTEHVIATAKANGCEVNTPGDYDLFLDFDTEEQRARLVDRLARLEQILNTVITIERITTSASGKDHCHIYLKLDDEGPLLTKEMRLMCQMFLGSDPVKELLSLDRLENNITPHSILIEGNWKGKEILWPLM